MKRILITLLLIGLTIFSCKQIDATVYVTPESIDITGDMSEEEIVKGIFFQNGKPLPLSLTSTYNKDANGHIIGLYLDRYDLSILPDNIEKLTQLQYISAENNRIFLLPSTVGNLKHLEVLDLKGNLISMIPETIKECKNLQIVNLSSNLLEEFPTAFLELPELIQLRLGDNKISSLPADYSGLKKLEYLDLGNNQLTTIPAGIGQIPGLVSLLLGNNRLYCENGVQNTSLIPAFLTDGSIANVQGLYTQNCSY